MLGSSVLLLSGNCLGAAGGAGVGRRVEWGSAQLSLPLETRVGLPILIHLNFLFGSFEPVEKTLDCASKIVEKVGTSREKLLWAFLNNFEKKIQIIVSTKIIVSKKIIVSNKIIISIIFQGISFSSLDIALLVWNLCRPIPQP